MVAVSRAALQSEYTAAFQLIAAMNPCPCGRRGDPAGDCRCTPAQVRRYCGRISGPLLDRLDMQVEVPRVTAVEFDAAAVGGESSAAAAARVARARSLQRLRQGRCNARLADLEVQRWCVADEAGRRLLEETMRQRALSGRARARLLRLARTVADLEGAAGIGAGHVAEAIMLRTMDRALVAEPIARSAPCDRRPA
jgi:magnesium chelatase family protein